MRLDLLKNLPKLLLGFLLLSSATGCGSSMYRASAASAFEIDNAKEIDDAEVGKAFAASPQVPDKPRVAFYAFDDAKAADIEKSLAAIPTVSGVYRIPPLLVTGKRKFDDASWGPPREISVKKLRLLAARAHADVLVVFDNGWRGGGGNGFAALNILIVPIFIAPWLSNETESYAQAYVIDVRNGYLYGEVSAEAKDGKSAVNIYAPDAKELAEARWPKLLESVKDQVATKLREGTPPKTEASSREAPARGE
jgi:hypothetical protein